METFAVGDLVHLPARAAVRRYFAGLNETVLRRLLVVAVPMSLLTPLVRWVGSDRIGAALWLPAALLSLTLAAMGRNDWFRRRRAIWTPAFLVCLVISAAIGFPEEVASTVIAGFVIPAVLPLFRLSARSLTLVAVVNALATGAALWRSTTVDVGSRLGVGIAALVFQLAVVAFTWSRTRKTRDGFLAQWRLEVAREKDRARMLTELEDAREIQLSMLPLAPPALPWLDISSVSLPASEVGGDYFDFFQLPGSRLAVVIGDVAGHGVASGLVLSGVRSGLHLLDDRLEDPVGVLERLDRMLRATVGGRIFMTFQIAVLDPIERSVRVANAGHPPLLKVARNGSLTRLGEPGLPLGTRLSGEYSIAEAPLVEGDVLVQISDGVIEVRNHRDDVFGDQRLEAVLRGSAELSSRRLRDNLLSNLSRFKGDAEQEDDLTVVLTRVGDLSSG